jgi:predicted HTH domain antitoxin
MEYIQHIRKTDLARNTHQIIRDVQRGYTVLVENHGQPEAAILDIVDYHILLAVTAFYAHPVELEPDAGLNSERLSKLNSPQEIYDLVMTYYLADAISLGKTAELLDLPWLDLRTRFIRLDIPIKLGPEDETEAGAEAETARKF